MSTFLTTEELAERWHMTPGAVHNRRSRGDSMPKSIKTGKLRLWPLEEVEAYEQTRLREGN